MWLAADTKGLLVFIPGTSLVARIANFVISSAIFVFLSENVATATGSLTTWLVGKPVKAKPARGAYTPVTTDTESKEVLNVEEDPPKKTKMQRLLAMLATDLRVKAVFIVGLLWVCNLLFPSDPPPEGHLVSSLSCGMRLSTNSSNQATYSLIRANLCKLPFWETRCTSTSVTRLLSVQLTRYSIDHFEGGA